MKRGVILLLSGLMLSGCVNTQTAYLDERTEAISALGGAVLTMADVERKVMLTAAQDAQKRGCRYFVFLSAENASKPGTIYLPGQTYTTGTATAQATAYGNRAVGTAQYSQQSYSIPGAAIPIVQPGQDVIVRFFKEGEMDPRTPGVWDSQSVLATQAKN